MCHPCFLNVSFSEMDLFLPTAYVVSELSGIVSSAVPSILLPSLSLCLMVQVCNGCEVLEGYWLREAFSGPVVLTHCGRPLVGPPPES